MILDCQKQKKADKFAEKICGYFGLVEQDIINKGREELVVNARYFTWYFLHYHLNISTNKLSQIYTIEKRNIYYGMRKIRLGIKNQPFYKKIYDDLKIILRL